MFAGCVEAGSLLETSDAMTSMVEADTAAATASGPCAYLRRYRWERGGDRRLGEEFRWAGRRDRCRRVAADNVLGGAPAMSDVGTVISSDAFGAVDSAAADATVVGVDSEVVGSPPSRKTWVMMTNHSRPNTATTTARPIVTLRLPATKATTSLSWSCSSNSASSPPAPSTRGSRRLHMRRRPEPSVRFPAAGRRVADDA